MSRKKIALLLAFALFVGVIAIGGIIVYSYQHGGLDNHNPPAASVATAEDQAINDLKSIAQAIETYYVKNLSYPSNLQALEPEYLHGIPIEKAVQKPYTYRTDGMQSYQIRVSRPDAFNLKELYLENGKVVKN